MASKGGATFDEVRELLARAAEVYHVVRADQATARAEQFDSHLATVAMVVDCTDDEITQEN
ncbi:MAG TPA: hypothetical protein VJX66_32020 [Amycolatopsis sp.]|nr:hypothetical protein [Amycolatopsis sp.]